MNKVKTININNKTIEKKRLEVSQYKPEESKSRYNSNSVSLIQIV